MGDMSFGGIVIVTLIIIFGLLLLAFGIGYWAESNQIQVLVDGQKIYSGAKFWVEITSGGDTTTITIKHGFLALFTERVYTGKDIIVKPLE